MPRRFVTRDARRATTVSEHNPTARVEPSPRRAGPATRHRFDRHDRRMQMRRQFQLIDFGGGARLERFGERIVDRPHPAALGARRDAEAVAARRSAVRSRPGVDGPAANAGPWPIASEGLTMELRPTEAGQAGLFPEHLAMLPWLDTRIGARSSRRRRRRRRRGPPPVRLHGPRHAGDGSRRRGRHARGRRTTDGRLGTPQCRAVRPGRPPDPLDRR